MLNLLPTLVLLFGSADRAAAIQIRKDCDRVLAEISRGSLTGKPIITQLAIRGDLALLRDHLREARLSTRDDGSAGARMIGEVLSGFLLSAEDGEELRIGSEEGTFTTRVRAEGSGEAREYVLDLVNDHATRNLGPEFADRTEARLTMRTKLVSQAFEVMKLRTALLLAAGHPASFLIALKLTSSEILNLVHRTNLQTL